MDVCVVFAAPAAAAAAPAAASGPKTYTMDVVATHNKDKDCWVVIDKKVYDVSNFLDDHPVGRRRGRDGAVVGCGSAKCAPLERIRCSPEGSVFFVCILPVCVCRVERRPS